MPQPVEQYHQVPFDDTISAERWAAQLAEAIARPTSYPYMEVHERAVIWRVLPHGAPTRPGHVFVSDGALRIARELGLAPARTTPVGLPDLPGGLSLLLGDVVDREAYGRSRRGRGPA